MIHLHNIPILKALRQDVGGLVATPIQRVFNRRILKVHRAVLGWLDLMRKAIQYGVDTQMIQGLEPLIDTLVEYEPWEPKTRFAKEAAEYRAAHLFDETVEKAQFSGVVATLADWNCIRMEGDKRIGPQLGRVYADSAKAAGELARYNIRWDLVNEQAVNWAKQHTNHLVTMVTAETKAALRQVISDGIKAGQGYYDVGRAIRPLVGLNGPQATWLGNYRAKLEAAGVSPAKVDAAVRKKGVLYHHYRAEMIARTETARAMTAGSLEAYDEAGVEMVRFESAGDPCEICADLHGNRYTAHEADGMIPVHQHCRCCFVPLVGSRKPPTPKGEPGPDAGRIIGPPDFGTLTPKEIGERLVYENDLGGSTGARLFRDAQTGKKWVVKSGAGATPQAHAVNEVVANALYEGAGVSVPKSYVGQIGGQNVGVMEFRTGKSASQYIYGDDLAKLRAAAQKDFVADAWLGNWDVVGAGYDNLLVPTKNISTILRIDNGGSMAYRARGGVKHAWSAEVGELKTMMDPSINPSAARLFGGMDEAKVLRQIDKLGKRMTDGRIDSILKSKLAGASRNATTDAIMVEDYRKMLTARKDWLKQYAKDRRADLALERKVAAAARRQARLDAARGVSPANARAGQQANVLEKIKPDPSVVAEIEQEHLVDIQSYANRAHMSLEEYKQAVSKHMDELFKAPDVRPCIRVKEDILRDKIIPDGRFKNQFETHTSGGSLSYEGRAAVEKNLMGYEQGTPANERTIYGYWSSHKNAHTVTGREANYGEVAVRLKASVKTRATFTAGDSLGEMYVPELPGKITVRGGDGQNMLGFKHIGDASSYHEAQIHGGVLLDDIDTIVFKRSPRPETVAAMEKHGIKWIVDQFLSGR